MISPRDGLTYNTHLCAVLFWFYRLGHIIHIYGCLSYTYIYIYMRYIIFPHAVRFLQSEIDWGLFYAVITDFYLPPDTVKK